MLLLIAALAAGALTQPDAHVARLIARFIGAAPVYDDAFLSARTRDNPAEAEETFGGKAAWIVARVSSIERRGAQFRLHLGPRDPIPEDVLTCDLSSRREAARLHRGQLLIVSGRPRANSDGTWRVDRCRVDYDFTTPAATAMHSYETCLFRMEKKWCAAGGTCPDTPEVKEVIAALNAIPQKALLRCGAPIMAAIFDCDGSDERNEQEEKARPLYVSCTQRRELLEIRNESFEGNGHSRRENGNLIEPQKAPASRLYAGLAHANGWEDNP